MKRIFTTISLGVFNILHASTHLLQAIQSFGLIYYSHDQHEHHHDNILYHPVLQILYFLIGVFTLYIGVKDFIHHRKCENN